MDDEVDLSGVGLVAGLEGAGVEALVTEPHLGDEDGELLWCVDEQPNPRVAGPTVIARVQDVRAVQPGYPGHMLINEAAGGEGRRRDSEPGRGEILVRRQGPRSQQPLLCQLPCHERSAGV